MGIDDSCWRMSLCRVGVKLSPEYDVSLPVALLWSDDHQRLN